MSEVRDGGNRSERQKDDEYTPVHKTEEFRQTIRRIREGQPVAAKVQPMPKEVQFNVPLPGIAPKKRTSTRRGSSFDQTKYEQALEKTVREQVNKEFGGQAPMGMSQEKVKKFIDEKVTERVNLIKRPRYTFLSDGTPFYLSKEDERADLERSLLGESPFRRRWMLAKYDIATGIGKVASLIGNASVKTKEILTDTNSDGNVAGAVAQLGLNSLMLGWQYIRATDYPILADEQKAKEMEQQAQALKYSDPAAAQSLLAQAADMRKGVQLKQQYMDSLHLAERAVDESWKSLFQEWDEGQATQARLREENPNTPQHELNAIRYEEMKKEQEAARLVAADIRAQATQAYGEGNFPKAIELIKQAQEEDRNGTFADPYGAYTWVREPERYEKMKEDAAFLELQKGAPLSTEEIRRLKEYHANSWTELTGEFIYDPINLIPAAMMDKIMGLPVKGISKANLALKEAFPLYGKTLHVMGSPARWLLRESVQSGGNRIARQTYNIFERVSNSYLKTEDVTKAIDEISNVILDAKRAPNEQQARAIFDAAKKQVPGLQQITFRDFKQLMDSADHIDPTQWGKIYSDSLVKAEDDLIKVADARKVNPEEIISEFSKGRRALQEMSTKFHGAFVDPHRITKGSRLVDDTIAGWVTKTMRNLSGDEVNEMLKTTKFDEWVMKQGTKLAPKAKSTLQWSTKWVEASLGVAANVRDIWATVVLTTPRWFMNNLMDTSMRSVVYGGNLWDDLVTLFTSTQRTLADELGFVPIEFSQALSRADLDFAETVTSRLLYEGWKPKAGIFSYMGYEYKRLLTQHGDEAVTKTKLLGGMLEKLPEGKLKNSFASLVDGYNYRVSFGAALGALSGGIADFNTAIEFTYRLRMFHREYFSLLEKIEPKFMEKGLDGLNPATKEIAKQIWKAAEGNPRRITAYVDNMIGKGGKLTPAELSFVVPPELDETLKGMDITDRQLFIAATKNELDEFISTATRNGKKLTGDDYKKFFDDYLVKMQDEIQARLSKSHDFRGMDGSISKDGKTANIDDADNLKGSAPIPDKESPRNKLIEEATTRLKRSNKRRSTVDINTDFETAVSDYARVERVSGDGVRVVKRGEELVIEVGDNALKEGPTKFYNRINDALVSIFKNQDADLIKSSGFVSGDQYELTMRKFFDDPTAVLNENEQHFLTLANQMENHPQLRALIEQTSPKTVRNYDSALDAYRNIGEYSDVYGFTRRPDVIFESQAQKLRPQPGSHIAAANLTKEASRKLAEVSQSIDPKLGEGLRDFLDQWVVHRQELKQFYAFTYPGPLLQSTKEGGRHAGWDLFYKMSEAEFRGEAAIKQKILDLIQSSPEEAQKILDEANGDFTTWFLKQNGIELEWDADAGRILNIKHTSPVDGRVRNFTSREDIGNLHIRFFSPQARKAMAENAPLRISTTDPAKIKRALTLALRDTFQTDTAHADAWAKVIYNHAEKWAQETGQPIEKYFDRLGFQRIDSSSAKGLGTIEQTRVVKRGAVKRAEDGTFMFYGLSHSNFESMIRETGELFFDDLISMAEHSPQAAEDLANLKKFIESKTGRTIRGNHLEQVHSDALAEVFSGYVATGHGPNISVKGGFDRLKSWLASTFDVIKDTKIVGDISEENYRILDRLFTETKLNDVPQTNARTIRSIAREANLITDDEDELLTIINNKLNEEAVTPLLSAEQRAQREALESEWHTAEEEYRSIVEELGDLAGDSGMANAMIGNNPKLMAAEERMNAASDAIRKFDEGITAAPNSARADLENNLRIAQEELDAMKKRIADTDPEMREAFLKGYGHEVRSLEYGVDEAKKALDEFDAAEYKDYGDVIKELKEQGLIDTRYNWERNPEDVPVLWRSMSEAEYKNIQETGQIQSKGAMNLEGQEGHTFYSNSPSRMYAEDSLREPIVKTIRERDPGFPDITPETRVYHVAVKNDPSLFQVNKQGEYFTTAPLDKSNIIQVVEGKQFFDENGMYVQYRMLPNDAPVAKSTVTYKSLGEVPKEVAARVLGVKESAVMDELQQGWEVWKTQRGLVGFPEEALKDLDTFKAYLKTRMGQEWSEASAYYNRLLWEVEQFENAMLNFHTGDDLATTIFPRVHEAQISDGMKTFIRNQEKMISNYEQARRALVQWGEYMGKLADEGHPAQLLTKEEQAALQSWSMRASGDKAEMVDLLLHGGNMEGKTLEGAIDKVNRVMLDYQSTNTFDQTMKNFFPFWMFPSRSFPFWAETLATHPQLIANYEKINRLSRSQRYQAKAVTSQGKPLPSLDGYIKLPGTDMWFNPLAPLSFRYILDVAKSRDDIMYAAQSQDDVEPKAFMVREMMETGAVYGFSPAPWVTWFMKQAYAVPDEVMPRYPLIPEIQLIPRWAVQELIHRANKINLMGMEIQGLGDAMYPEAPWHDYLVERRILENALQDIQTGNLSEADKLKIMSKAQAAIKYKNDPLWQQTYKEMTSEEWSRSMMSFFSGMYPKEFSDSSADLLALRNDLNRLKSSLNNEFQSNVFDLPVQSETAWANYLKVLDTPEGWVHRLYTDIGWVKNSQGELVRDPKDRAHWLAKKIEMDEDQQMYYDKMSDLQKEFNTRIRALPIGASWDQAKIVYDWYSKERASLDYLRTFEKVYGTNKPVELIQKDLAQDWFREISATRPSWNVEAGETYDQYQQRVMEWETNLPNIAPMYLRAYMRRQDLNRTLNALHHQDQQFNVGEFFNGLVAQSTKDGLEAWEKENDDVFDALNKAWKATYWDEYWHNIIGKDGYEVDLAESEFYGKHKNPPSADELYAWISTYYGPDKFTPDEIKKWVEGTDELDILQRQLQTKDDPIDYQKRQDIWDMLSWLGPGSKNRGVFDQAFLNAGGDPDMLTTWYQEAGEAYKTRPEKLDQLHGTIQAAITALGLQAPKREELVRYVQAQHENDTFKQLVSSELGDGFFDYTDENGVTQQGLYSYYNSLSSKDKKEFRSNHEEYALIEDYYSMKETFQEEHPTWADYYGFDTEPSVSLPVNETTGTSLTPPNPNVRVSKGGGGSRPTGRPTQTPTGSTYNTSGRIPYFNISDRGSNYISPNLYRLVGNKMAWEITQMYSSNRKISTSGVSFLRSLASRYPEYQQEINNILSKGT